MLVSKGVECTLVLRKKKCELLLEAEQLCDIYEVAPDNIFQIIPRCSINILIPINIKISPPAISA